MDLKKTGLVVAIVGVILLSLGLLMGGIVGYNSRTIAKYQNDEDHSEKAEERMDRASEVNAFLGYFIIGVNSLGMGLLMIGGGLAIAKDRKNNWVVLMLALMATVVLLIGLSIYFALSLIHLEAERINNNEDFSEGERERYDSIEEAEMFLSTFNSYLAGFRNGSLGIGLAFLTIPLAAVLRTKDPKHDKDRIAG